MTILSPIITTVFVISTIVLCTLLALIWQQFGHFNGMPIQHFEQKSERVIESYRQKERDGMCSSLHFSMEIRERERERVEGGTSVSVYVCISRRNLTINSFFCVNHLHAMPLK